MSTTTPVHLDVRPVEPKDRFQTIMAAYDARRPTRDIDLHASGIEDTPDHLAAGSDQLANLDRSNERQEVASWIEAGAQALNGGRLAIQCFEAYPRTRRRDA